MREREDGEDGCEDQGRVVHGGGAAAPLCDGERILATDALYLKGLGSFAGTLSAYVVSPVGR
jgi:hypothetical protein